MCSAIGALGAARGYSLFDSRGTAAGSDTTRAIFAMLTLPVGGFHRRELPEPATGLSTAEGKNLFRQALAEDGAEIFFRVSEAFRTQDEPAYCGLGTLVTVLNALEVDPGELWKGTWRWYAESMLGCCVDLAEIQQKGVAWDEWCCIARCQGLAVAAVRAEVSDIAAFRATVATSCAGDSAVVCVSYSRAVLGQQGDGHYSPIGAYVPSSDMVLIMDVARFKHPPHWVPLATLWEAMCRADSTTGHSRGYATLARAERTGSAESSILLTIGRGKLSAARAFFGADVADATSAASTAEEELWKAARALPPAVAALVTLRDTAGAPEGSAAHERLTNAHAGLRAHPVYEALGAIADKRAPGRDGPLPAPVGACAALLVVAVGAVGEEAIRASFPKAAVMLLSPLEGGAKGGETSRESAFARDVRQARAALADLVVATKRNEDEINECCAHRHHRPPEDLSDGGGTARSTSSSCCKPGQCED